MGGVLTRPPRWRHGGRRHPRCRLAALNCTRIGEIHLDEGDLLFFYTDGLVEMENERGEMFGAERLEAVLIAEHEGDIDTVLERVEGRVRSFRGGAEPFDDATMMALKVGREMEAVGQGVSGCIASANAT